jgi:hypothetical protein
MAEAAGDGGSGARRAAVAAVLRRSSLRRVAVAYGAFNLAEHATWLAVTVFAYGRGGATEAGLIGLLQLAPGVVVAPVAALLGDRYPRSRVLLASYLVQGIAMLATGAALLGNQPAVAVYAFAVLAATVTTLSRPAHAALLPALAETPAELTAAIVVSGSLENAGILVGPALAGVLLELSGPGEVFVVAALALSGASAAVARVTTVAPSAALPVPAADAGDTAPAGVRAIAGGLTALVTDSRLRAIVGLLLASLLLVGFLDVFYVVLALGILGTGEAGAGLLNAALGAGGMLGAALSLALVGRSRLAAPLLASIAVFGGAVALIGFAPSAVLAPILIGVAGTARAVGDVAARTLLQRVAPDAVLSRIFGVLEGLDSAALAVGAVAVPVLVGALGAPAALAVAGIALPLVGLLGWRGLAVADAAAVVPARQLALLRGIPIFAALPPPILERLATRLVPVRVPAGATVIREGEAGDLYYVVAAGRVEVTVGDRTMRRQGPGEGFGEIALLRDVPRTATVRAIEDTLLFSLDRDTFLAAVTNQPVSRAIAASVVERRLAGAEE